MARRPIYSDVTETGMVPDVEAHLTRLGDYNLLKNVRWVDGSLERVGTSVPIEIVSDGVQLDGAPAFVQGIRNGFNFYHVILTNRKAYLWDGSILTDITRTSGPYTAGGRWQGTVLNGVPIFNNGLDIPQAFTNPSATVNLVDLPEWPTEDRTQIIRSYLNVLVMLGMSTSGSDYVYRLKWSHPADPGNLPETYDETDSTKDVALSELASTEDVLIDGLTLNSNFLIYKQNTTWTLRPSGGINAFNSLFSISQLFDEAGMLASGCGVRLPKNKHFVLTADDIIVHNGNDIQSVAVNQVRRWLFANIEPTYYSLSYVVAQLDTREVWICFPEKGAEIPTLALVWNMDLNKFTVREIANCRAIASGVYQGDGLENTWDSDTGTWDGDVSTWDTFSNAALKKAMLGVNDTGMVLLDRDDFELPVVALLEKLDSPYGELNRVGQVTPLKDNVKFWRTIWPRFTAPTGTVFTFQFGFRDYIDDAHPIQWGQVFSYTIGIDTRIDPYIRGKYISYRIMTTASVPWKFHGFQIDVAKLGQF